MSGPRIIFSKGWKKDAPEQVLDIYPEDASDVTCRLAHDEDDDGGGTRTSKSSSLIFVNLVSQPSLIREIPPAVGMPISLELGLNRFFEAMSASLQDMSQCEWAMLKCEWVV